MLRLLFLLIFTWVASPVQGQPTGEPTEVEVRSPIPGQTLQGSVPVVADLPKEGIEAIEISFAYEGDERDTWFLIDEISDTFSSGELTMWDTTTLTDGVYTLRLSVQMEDGEQRTVEVNGLRVRNYTPVETNTPAPLSAEETEEDRENQAATQATLSLQTATLPASPEAMAGPFTSLETPTPEPSPLNPAQVSYPAVLASLGKGALAAAAALLLVGIYRWVQQAFRDRKDSF